MQHLENQGCYMKIQLSKSYLTYRHLNNYGKIVVMMKYYIAKGKEHREVKSTKPPYAERYIQWCGRSVNMRVGGKYQESVFSSYSRYL